MTNSNEWSANQVVDLNNCDREPIHIPNRIQPHGVLLVAAEPSLKIMQVSRNAATLLGVEPDELLESDLSSLLVSVQADAVKNHIKRDELMKTPLHIFTGAVGNSNVVFDCIAHRANGLLILELERSIADEAPAKIDSHSLTKAAILELRHASLLRDLCQRVAEAVRTLTRFDRVMVYKFLEDESGVVIAEAKNEIVEPFLDLHYPATDIPQQARRLYLLNPLRLIPDINYEPAELTPSLNPLTKRPLDMSQAVLRSVSPIHLEYLRNMGVTASMSISLIKDDRLWGLIACHHYAPKYVSFEVRSACELLSQIFAMQIETKEAAEDSDYKARLTATLDELLRAMAREAEFTDGLVKSNPNLLDLIDAGGAALYQQGKCTLLGTTPTERAVKHLAKWLATEINAEVYATDKLPQIYSPASEFKDVASGLLAVSISRGTSDYVMWFRPEVIQTVKWGGDPHKPVTIEDGGERLSPRKSFAMWKETVHLRSLAWKKVEVQAAHNLRRAIVEVVLSKAEELTKLNYELERSNAELDAFTFMASHDLKEPLRGIYNYSQFLAQDHTDQLDADGQAKLQTLMRLAGRMDEMIDNLLHYSRVGQMELARREVDLNEVVGEVLDLLRSKLDDSNFTIRLPRLLPIVEGDRLRIEEIYTNLLTNAIKYNDKAEKWIEIGFIDPRRGDAKPSNVNLLDSRDNRILFYVRDNGIGIREKHYEQIFRLFKRLHGRAQYGGGTGAGLTIVRRIIERHGGDIQVESVYGAGTTFYFTLQD